MGKYKKSVIPHIRILERVNLKDYIRKTYSEKIQGKTVVNKHIGLTIYFGSDGKSELSSGRAIYAKKAALVQCLPELLINAEYNNFGQRKEKDAKNVFGYANFKAKVFIDDKLEHVRITVKVKANGKGYYCHEVNIKK